MMMGYAGLATAAATSKMPMQGMVPDEELQATYELERPFYIEPIVSWRAWKCSFDGDTVVLRSITYQRVVWPNREELKAECQREILARLPGHVAPNQTHGCGIYSVKTSEDALLWALANRNGPVRVIGEVKIWGRILQYERGYISEYAYPANFYVPENYDHWEIAPDAEPEELALALESTFKVPVGVGWPA